MMPTQKKGTRFCILGSLLILAACFLTACAGNNASEENFESEKTGFPASHQQVQSPTPNRSEVIETPRPAETEPPVRTIEICGVLTRTDASELDLSGIPFSSPQEVSEQLALLPNLEKVEMCNCGLSNEQMETLLAAFPDVKFVWMIQVGAWTIRTDITAFSKGQRGAFPNGMGRFTGEGKTNFHSEDLEPLKYCRDLVFLDLGHGNRITDLSILSHFPKLRGLILSMNKITDLSPVAELKELECLEIYQNYVEDLSPLEKLPKLRYLNCSRNSFKDITPLLNMKQLEMLWLINTGQVTEDLREQLAEALPGCKICYYGNSSASSGWKDNGLYVEYQKAYGLPYRH